MEVWKPIENWPYEVSDLGRVRRARAGTSTWAGRILTPRVEPGGYLTVRLSDCDRCQNQKIHRLVLIAFAGPPPPGHEVNHLDGDKTNNRWPNLEWVTKQQNHRHATIHGLKARGERTASAKLTQLQVRQIRVLGSAGYSHGVLANHFGVSRTTVGNILHWHTWRTT